MIVAAACSAMAVMLAGVSAPPPANWALAEVLDAHDKAWLNAFAARRARAEAEIGAGVPADLPADYWARWSGAFVTGGVLTWRCTLLSLQGEIVMYDHGCTGEFPMYQGRVVGTHESGVLVEWSYRPADASSRLAAHDTSRRMHFVTWGRWRGFMSDGVMNEFMRAYAAGNLRRAAWCMPRWSSYAEPHVDTDDPPNVAPDVPAAWRDGLGVREADPRPPADRWTARESLAIVNWLNAGHDPMAAPFARGLKPGVGVETTLTEVWRSRVLIRPVEFRATTIVAEKQAIDERWRRSEFRVTLDAGASDGAFVGMTLPFVQGSATGTLLLESVGADASDGTLVVISHRDVEMSPIGPGRVFTLPGMKKDARAN